MAPTNEEARERTITTAAHPLVLAAGALVVLNDYVLREVSPGWLTGKLSDVGFLVVAPVACAAALAMMGAPARWARGVGLVGTAALYTVLQLWPPLGALFRASHVADAEDLLVLPALVGAVLAWRSPWRRPIAGAVALPFLAGVLVATSWTDMRDASWPCGDGMEWEPAHPLLLQFGAMSGPYADTDHFLRGMRLTDEHGVDVPLVATNSLAVCAREGLRGDTEYTWTIGPWGGVTSNELGFSHEGLPTVRFRTLPGPGVPAPDMAACAALAAGIDRDEGRRCGIGVPLRDTFHGPFDTGDTGDTGDTADSGDSGDSGDTADSAAAP